MSVEFSFSGEKINQESTADVSKTRRFASQIIATFVKNVLLLVYGLSIGVPTLLVPNLGGGVPGESIILDENGISWIGSLNYLSVPLGCILSGTATRVMGRIKSMQAICLVFFGAFLLFYFASNAWQVFLGLFLTGFSGGLLEAPTLIYTVETSEPELRGTLSSTATLSIVIGIILSFLFGTIYSWRTMALINACIPLAGLVLLFVIPESPYWLISKGREEEAKKKLAWLRGWTKVESIEPEFKSICNTLKQDAADQKFKENKRVVSIENIKLYFKATFVKPFLLICLTFVIAHFGMTPMNVYAIKIFTLLRAPIDSYYATVVIGVSELIGSILLLLLLRYLGKRVFTFISLMGIAISFLIAGIYSYIIKAHYFDTTSIEMEIADKYNWVPLVSISCMGFFSYLMTYPLPWIIMAELFPNEVRDNGAGLSAGAGYIIGFVANKTFLNIVNLTSLPGVFWLYSGVAILGLILMYFLLPETEGKTLFEITEHYAGNEQLSNKVLRGSIKKSWVKGVTNKGYVNSEANNTDTKL